MRFVHIADVHLDIPFGTISQRASLGEERRIEQRNALKKVIEFIKENNIDYLFICGDLYEQEYIRESSIAFVNSLFKQIPNTKVYIVPGNHDPYIKNSYYANYSWSDNVKIFTSVVEKVENEDVNIYGYGFGNFEMYTNKLDEIKISDLSKVNILLTHAELVHSPYNPINVSKLREKGFDYVALGHIHKRDDSTNIVYPGSLISLGFDELGKHGMIVGEIINKKVYKHFIQIDEREFIEKEIDVSNIYSEEELIEIINSLEISKNLYKVILTGYRNFPIKINIKLIKDNIIKIKDLTKLKIDITENDYTLKGIFLKKLNQKMSNNEIDEETYEYVLEIGKQVLEKNNNIS